MNADDGLERLLLVERQLEVRVREAEGAAEARIAAAREASRDAARERGADLETATVAEEAADLERHAAELERIARETAAYVARTLAVSEADVDRMASRAVAAVVGRQGVRPP